jgi:hypothetical protein
MVKGQNCSSPFPLETGNTEPGGLPPVSHPENAAQGLQIMRILQRQRNRQEGRTLRLIGIGASSSGDVVVMLAAFC